MPYEICNSFWFKVKLDKLECILHANTIKHDNSLSYENIKARNHFKVSFSQKKIRVTNNRITQRKSQNLLIMLHAYVVRFLSKKKRKESQKRSMVYTSLLS